MQSPSFNQLECKISAQSSQKYTDGLWVNFSIQSKYDKPVMLLTWQTPLEGIMGDLFVVKDEAGNVLTYQGPMIKRSAPTESDFISLEPNKSAINKVNLSLVYQLQAGKTYHLNLKDRLFNIIDSEQKQQFVRCDISDEILVSLE